MQCKVVKISDACQTIQNGDTVAIGGLTIHRKPMSFIHELIRSKKKELHLLTLGGSIDVDLLIAAGILKKIDAAYVGLEILGFAPNFRKAVEANLIEFNEHTEYSIIAGLEANLMEAEFIPSKLLIGTDILKNLNYKTFRSPITDDLLVAYPRICPDVAIIHVQRCDEHGNCQISGINAIDLLLAKSSKRVIVTTEKIFPTEDFMTIPSSINLPSTFVDFIIESPFGAHPTSCFPNYTYDLWHLIHYIDLSKKGRTEDYLTQHITNLDSFDGYLNLVNEDVKRVTVQEP
jgi:glutaconate CoA-transferase subunit A